MNQLDVNSVFFEQSLLVRHEHAALRPGYSRPIDAHGILGQRRKSQK
jgi:hypothetical protein